MFGRRRYWHITIIPPCLVTLPIPVKQLSFVEVKSNTGNGPSALISSVGSCLSQDGTSSYECGIAFFAFYQAIGPGVYIPNPFTVYLPASLLVADFLILAITITCWMISRVMNKAQAQNDRLPKQRYEGLIGFMWLFFILGVILWAMAFIVCLVNLGGKDFKSTSTGEPAKWVANLEFGFLGMALALIAVGFLLGRTTWALRFHINEPSTNTFPMTNGAVSRPDSGTRAAVSPPDSGTPAVSRQNSVGTDADSRTLNELGGQPLTH